jgi:hypothetical protein
VRAAAEACADAAVRLDPGHASSKGRYDRAVAMGSEKRLLHQVRPLRSGRCANPCRPQAPLRALGCALEADGT